MRRKKASKYRVPVFDESILSPTNGESVVVFHTRANQEFALEKYCKSHGIPCYLPVRRAIRVHNIFRKGNAYSYSEETLRPMFASYIFLKLSPQSAQVIRNSNIYARCLPLQYSQEQLLQEIQTIRIVETIGFEQELEVHTDIPKGGHFLITSGVWSGVKGYLVNKDGVDKWTVLIEFCQQAVTTIIDPTQFKMMPADD